ncbi:MAG: EamA family transporter [Nakamurella sp.]
MTRTDLAGRGPGTTRPRRDATWLVAIAAALWGTDAIFRLPLAQNTAASTVVFAEHVILVLALSPFLLRAFRAFGASPLSIKLAAIGIGVGASAIATVLFTLSFRSGDPITPVVTQKLQPVIAMIGAALLLGERLRPRFALFAVPALIGAWLLAFPDPTQVSINRINVALLALGAATLWAAGTVLGRLASRTIGPLELTTLRFAFGLPASAAMVAATGSPWWVADLKSTGSVAALALVVGLVAMLLYYRGLGNTAASRATLAELAFPLTAAVIGILWFDKVLDESQWIGVALIVVAVTALSLHETRSRTTAVVDVGERPLVGTSG